MAEFADEAFPHVARFVRGYGWIEIGGDGISPSWIRLLDEGGLVWQSAEVYPTLDAALKAADAAIAEWALTILGERWDERRPRRGRRSARKSSDAEGG